MVDSDNNSCILKVVCILILTLTYSNAFLFNREPGVNPSLSKYTFNQEGKTLNLNLDISNPAALPTISQNNGRLYIRNIELQLGTKAPTIPINLPGSNGPSPKISSGPFCLEAKNRGSFISISGEQTLPLANSAWEMVWKEYNPAGSLIFGLNLDADVVRNAAVLKKGLLYLHFPVWTESGLNMARVERIAYEKELALLLKVQDSEIEKMRETKNPLEKALRLRNAVKANEKVTGTQTSHFDSVPMEDTDVMPLGDGLLICTKGTIWRKGTSKDFFGRVEHFLLGVASINNEPSMNSKE